MMSEEELIKYKNYHELSAKELDLIKDMAKNEAEFIQLKQFMGQTELHFKENKIVESEDMESKFLETLYPIAQERTSWWLPFFSFLFPAEKAWYQFPAVQFSGLLILLFGIFNLFESPFNRTELALNDKVEHVEKVQDLAIKKTDTIASQKKAMEAPIDQVAEVVRIKNKENESEAFNVNADQIPSPLPQINDEYTALAQKKALKESSLDFAEATALEKANRSMDKDIDLILDDVEESEAPIAEVNVATTEKVTSLQLNEINNNVSMEDVVIASTKKRRDRIESDSKIKMIRFKVKDILGLSELFYEVK